MYARIRSVVPQDSEELIKPADELIQLDNRAERESMLVEPFQDANHEIYVADVEGKLVGFIELRIFPDFVEGAPIAIIQNLIVEKHYRGFGIGSKLLQRAIREARRRIACEIHVWTEFENYEAINFYTKHGFTRRALLLEKET